MATSYIHSPIRVYAGEEYLGTCRNLKVRLGRDTFPDQVDLVDMVRAREGETQPLPIDVKHDIFTNPGSRILWAEKGDTAQEERERVLNLIEEALDDAPPEAQQRLNWLKDMVKG